MKLKISDDLSLPIEAATQTIGIVGKKGSGKTVTGLDLAEEFLKLKIAPVIIDPLDVAWGLKSAFPVYIFGGKHADLPLEPGAGKIIAQLVAEQHPPIIISLRELENQEQYGFVKDFVGELLRIHEGVVPVIMDEADKYAPERPGDKGLLPKCKSAVDRLVRHGRASGIGVTLITQRPALIDKNVLNQVDTLIIHRLIGPTDVDAIQNWLKRHATKDELQQILGSLATLQTGEAWVYSPEWLEVLKRVRFRMRETFDSSRTPKIGEKVAKPKELATVDVATLGAKIADTVERAKADDPRELRAQLAAAKKTIAQLEARPAEKAIERLEVPVLSEADEKLLRGSSATMMAAGQMLVKAIAEAGDMARICADVGRIVTSALGRLEQSRSSGLSTSSTDVANNRSVGRRSFDIRQSRADVDGERIVFIEEGPGAPIDRPTRPIDSTGIGTGSGMRPQTSNGDLRGGARKILGVAAQYDGGVTREQLTVMTGYKRSARDTFISRLRQDNYVMLRGDFVEATDAGIAALGADFEPLPTGADLRSYWLDRLSGGEEKILRVLIDSYPQPISREDLDRATNYKRSARDTFLSRLRNRRLVELTSEGVRASDQLFAVG